jgi:hypothetical protein
MAPPVGIDSEIIGFGRAATNLTVPRRAMVRELQRRRLLQEPPPRPLRRPVRHKRSVSARRRRRPDPVMSVESPAVLAMLGADKHAIFAGRPSLAVAVTGPILADELARLPTNMASKSVELTHVLEHTSRDFAVSGFMQQRQHYKGCYRYTMAAIRRRINAGSQPSNADRGSRTLNGDPPAIAGCPRRDPAVPRPGHGRPSDCSAAVTPASLAHMEATVALRFAVRTIPRPAARRAADVHPRPPSPPGPLDETWRSPQPTRPRSAATALNRSP